MGHLSLFERERMEVRDYWRRVFQALTRSPEERYPILRELGDSKSEPPQFLVLLEILLGPDRIFLEYDSRGRNRRVRWQASLANNRSPRCNGRSNAVAGIYNSRNFDFEDGAREYVRSRSRSCGDNGRATRRNPLINAIFSERKISGPSPQSSPRKRGEANSNSIWHRSLKVTSLAR